MLDIKIEDVIKLDEYRFLFENEHLKNRLLFLTFGGSHAYGTNVEGSDIDVRGAALNSPSDLIGLSNFEQLVDESTDTTVYAFNKLVGLLINCNPNVIEMLGCKSYIFYNDIGRQLVDNADMFLSQLAIRSFGGYANQQLRRLENAIARDRMLDEMKEQHILRSMRGAVASFESRYTSFEKGSLRLHIGESKKEDRDTEVLADIVLKDYPVRDFNGILSELSSIARDYEKLNSRNHKKDDAHLNKHAMHLVRLYLMCLDILEQGKIITYREKDRDMLLGIRRGKYQNEDGTYKSEFFDYITELDRRMDYAKAHTCLPVKPDMKKIEEFVMEVNRKVLF